MASSTIKKKSAKTYPTKVLLALAACASVATAAPYTPEKRLHSTTESTSKYEAISSYAGNTFFDHFTTYTGRDPTHGFVNYTDASFAAKEGLIGFVSHYDTNTTTAYIGVDHTNVAPNGRNSVRLISRETFDVGSMVVLDLNHIPSQYGVWPAIWMLGSQGAWPTAGESDILEYVHKTEYNTMTLHTAPGCSISNSDSFQGRLLEADCNAGNAATGCSVDAFKHTEVIASPSSNPSFALKTNKTMATAGSSFNSQGGGVYVHDWQADGITVWLFSHSAIPSDLIAGTPNPSTWTQKPLAKFTGNCDFSRAFKDMQLIINIDFGGDWAGKVWESSGAARATNYSTVNEYVANSPEAFHDTYFDIASIRFFSNNGQKSGNATGSAKRDTEADVSRLTTRAREGGNAILVIEATSDASGSEISAWLAMGIVFALVAFSL